MKCLTCPSASEGVGKPVSYLRLSAGPTARSRGRDACKDGTRRLAPHETLRVRAPFSRITTARIVGGAVDSCRRPEPKRAGVLRRGAGAARVE